MALSLCSSVKFADNLSMKTIILIPLLLCLKTFANNTSVVVKSVECLAGGQSTCGVSDMQSAAELAGDQAREKFEAMANQVIINQTNACRMTSDSFKRQCNTNLYRSLKVGIENIQTLMEEQFGQIASINQMGQIEAQNGTDISGLALKVEKLVSALKSSSDALATLQGDLDNLDQTCRTKFIDATDFCTEPIATSDGDSVAIYQNRSMELLVARTSAMESISYGDAEAEVQLQVEGKLDAPELRQQRNIIKDEYYVTSRIGGSTGTQLTETTSFAVTNLRQAELTLETLNSLLPNSDVREGSNCSGIEAATGACSSDSNSTPSGPTAMSSRPERRPETTAAQVGGDAATISNSDNSSENNGKAADSKGLSGDQLMADAQSKAFGATTESSANNNDKSVQAKASGFGGQAGGFGKSLSELGSIFGKSGGSFGEDGYSSGASARYGSPNKNYRSSNSSGTQLSTGTIPYNPNRSSSNQKFPQAIPPPSRGNFANSQGQFPRSPVGGGGAGGLGTSSGNAGGTKTKDKPGLLSRLFGKNKKDKTMFGKNASPGGGGKFRSAGNDRANRRGLDLSGSEQRSKDKARTFNADNYKPTAAAQARAYARATGRSLASTYNPNLAGPSTIEWPKDISKNRARSMFFKIGLSVKDQIRD